MKTAFLLLAIVAIMMTGCATTTTMIDFSNLSSVTPPASTTPVKVGDSFKVGDVLIEKTSQVKLVILPFKTNSPIFQDPACPMGVTGWTPGGQVNIVQDNMSGGTGTELHFDNVCLGIIAPSGKKVSDMKLKFGDHGGNINLIVNGALLNYEDFNMIPPPAGINLTVAGSTPLGTLEISGELKQFYFSFPCPAFFPLQNYTAVVGGGQELWIDDIEFTLSD